MLLRRVLNPTVKLVKVMKLKMIQEVAAAAAAMETTTKRMEALNSALVLRRSMLLDETDLVRTIAFDVHKL